MTDGLPILLATVPPAIALLLGRIDVMPPTTALWAAVVVSLLQLVSLGGFVGFLVSGHIWRYAAATAGFGMLVVVLVVSFGH